MRARENCRERTYDAVVVGSGPNGMACAIAMLQAGNSVLLVEGQDTAGGGCRTAELTVSGFRHDICSAVHPLGIGSPFFRKLPLEKFGLRWINPEAAYAHAFKPGRALVVFRDLDRTAEALGQGGESFRRLMSGLLPDWDELCDVLLQPLKLVRHPLALAKFGVRALLSAQGLAERFLSTPESRAVFAGVAAHSSLRLDSPGSASIALSLCVAAHAVGWPIPEGGAQAITTSLIGYFRSLGGELITGCPVRSLDDLPACRYLFLDLTPRQFLQIAGEYLPRLYTNALKLFRYGPGCFKMDWALSQAVPWSSPDFLLAPTVHFAGDFEEVAASEKTVWQGRHSEKPYVLLAQPSVFDGSRSPAGSHVLWAYCHVPLGSEEDASASIESQIERFAPGFRKCILARSILNPGGLERLNENHVGGDINGGTLNLSQLLTRPIPQLIPFNTPLANVYLCSSSTPPGSGVHGMSGYYAAWSALRFGARDKMALSEDKSGSMKSVMR